MGRYINKQRHSSWGLGTACISVRTGEATTGRSLGFVNFKQVKTIRRIIPEKWTPRLTSALHRHICIHVLGTGMSSAHQHVLPYTYTHMPTASQGNSMGKRLIFIPICTRQKGETSRIKSREKKNEECLEWRTKDFTMNRKGHAHLL